MLSKGHQLSHYVIVRLLKSGGMGDVYLGDDTLLQRQVAIKVLRIDPTQHSDMRAMQEAVRLFLREAQAIARLDHIHILPLYDSDQIYISGIPLMYMVMPFRQEGSLAEWLQRHHYKRVSIREVALIVQQAASALQYAHDNRIIHQDVKPANFLIRSDTEHRARLDLQLADFGIARLMTTTSGESQLIRGTPAYVAPEQWEGHPVPATDQYALAVMAYELLTGQVPFPGNNPHQIMYMHFHNQPPPASSFNPAIPKDIDAVLLRALAKAPADRFSSVSAFANAFYERASPNISGNIFQTFTITSLEAQKGTSREITLPGGRQVLVNVPAGAYHGQVILLRGFGEQPANGGPPGALILTIAIEQIEQIVTLADAKTLEGTVPAFDVSNDVVPTVRRRYSKGAAIIFATLIVIVIMGSAGLFYVAQLNAIHTANVNATATAQSNLDTKATAQARIAATATAQARIAATATVQANLNATATAQANLTATATAYSASIEGTPEINDTLQDNGLGYGWDESNFSGGGGCSFVNGAYHSTMPQNNSLSPCFAQNTTYGNFSFQVQMTIVAGDQGGIIFRADSSKDSFYYFQINRKTQIYTLGIYDGFNSNDIISSGTSSAINTGLNQPNLLAVNANGSTLDLFVNMQKVATVNDSTYTQGQIGVAVYDTTASTDAIFSNVKVWSW